MARGIDEVEHREQALRLLDALHVVGLVVADDVPGVLEAGDREEVAIGIVVERVLVAQPAVDLVGVALELGRVWVVDEGVTGYVVSTVPEMVARLNDIDKIDRAVCRSTAEARFDVSRMARDYIRAYEQVLSKTEYQPSQPVSPVPIVA